MNTTQYLAEIIKELNRSVDLISNDEAEKLVNGILESKKSLLQAQVDLDLWPNHSPCE
jgi:hypothetical protein